MSSNSKRHSVVSNDKQGGRTEEHEGEYREKKEAVSVTSQLCIKPVRNSENNMDKEVVLRRIRHRKRMNKVRSAVGTFLRSPFSSNKNTTTDASSLQVQGKRWIDDAFAAL